MSPFYEARGVPVQTSVVLNSRDAALGIPTADIVLGLCTECGFIANLTHPDTVQIPEADYEDQQGFSPTFTSFASALAQRLVERYDLRGKRVVEIGCGKGDFLALLCEMGDNDGVGIDPLFRKGRLQSSAAGRITAVPELFSDAHARFRPDMVVCRHTLEHIPDVGRFLQTVRRTLEGTDAVVFEVPDAVRILDEAAFWDIYYEHCSYFSPGSMARAFRASGFDVVDLQREYGDQYLLLHARATNASGSELSALEEAVSDLAARVDGFAARVTELREAWRERAQGRPALWGSGSKCVAFVTTLGIADDVGCVVDINPHRHNRYIPGVGGPIVAPEFLKEERPDTVIVMNPVYRDEIEASVRGMGLDSDVIAV